MKKHIGFLTLILLFAGAFIVQANEGFGPENDSASENPNQNAVSDQAVQKMKTDATTEIRKAVKAYVAAFNSQDAKKIAALWTPDAVYRSLLSGEIIEGRAELQKEFAAQFAELKNAKITVATKSIEFISPSVAVEEGSATVSQPNMLPERSTYSVIYVKRDGKWLIDRVTEKEEVAVDITHYEKLKSLEWMVGTWIDQGDNMAIQTECKWVGNQNYLMRAFKVTSTEEDDEVGGMQFIGWDAHKKQIRSWVFDSQGGFAEGVWTKSGGNWIVKTKAVLADGKLATSTSILKLVDDNSFTWQKVNRVVDGELLPNIDEVLIVRE